MTERERFDFAEKKTDIYISRRGICEVCGKWVQLEESQLAHKIPQTKGNLEKYGKEVIHNPLNISLTCSLRCNASVNIQGNPIAKEILATAIKEGGKDEKI